jgi:hypothetical protein
LSEALSEQKKPEKYKEPQSDKVDLAVQKILQRMKMDAANDPVLQRKKRGDYKPIEFAQLLGAKPQVIKSLEDE